MDINDNASLMNLKKIITIFMVFFTVNAQADNRIGFYLGGQIWQSDSSGDLGEKNNLAKFDLKKETQTNYFIAFEHPYPLLPNVRVSKTTLDTTGKDNLVDYFDFYEQTFIKNTDLDVNFDVSYIDYTLYYEVIGNSQFSFDLGLSARDFDGAVTFRGESADQTDICQPETPPNTCILIPNPFNGKIKIKTDEVEPMLYVATKISLPLLGLSIFGQGDFSFMDNHSISDYQIGLSYRLFNNHLAECHLNLGYRYVKIDFEDLNKLNTDLDFTGNFAGVVMHF